MKIVKGYYVAVKVNQLVAVDICSVDHKTGKFTGTIAGIYD